MRKRLRLVSTYCVSGPKMMGSIRSITGHIISGYAHTVAMMTPTCAMMAGMAFLACRAPPSEPRALVLVLVLFSQHLSLGIVSGALRVPRAR